MGNLTNHFSDYEFKCKCGCDGLLLSDVLYKNLEKLFTALNCSKIIVNSGYRCKKHDIAVGGTGVGQHVNGKAADIMCYDKDGKIIPAPVVCAVAVRFFNGVSRIDKQNTSCHVDVADRIWYGDETVTTERSITNDFTKYFNLSAADIAKYTGGETKTEHTIEIIIDGKTIAKETYKI